MSSVRYSCLLIYPFLLIIYIEEKKRVCLHCPKKPTLESFIMVNEHREEDKVLNLQKLSIANHSSKTKEFKQKLLEYDEHKTTNYENFAKQQMMQI